MLFEEKSKGIDLGKPTTETKVRIDLEPKRENELHAESPFC